MGPNLKKYQHFAPLFLTFIVAIPILLPLMQWLFIDATWVGETVAACKNGEVRKPGACWPVVTQNLPVLLSGRFPREEAWRAYIVISLGIFSLALPALASASIKFRRFALASLFLYIPAFAICYVLLNGSKTLGLSLVNSEQWGGFALTVMLSLGAVVASVVPGFLLAFFRVKNYRLIGPLCAFLVEIVRGVPLITVLFVFHFLFPLFLPEGTSHLSEIPRALMALSLFLSVYVSEVWRGGFLSLAKGQTEAAVSLGLSNFRILLHVQLPQVFKVSAAGLVSTYIGLFKDTSLVTIVGVYDLLNVARTIPRNPDWLGADIEPLIFAAVVYVGVGAIVTRVGSSLGKEYNT